MERRRVLYSGHVQGVGFRYTAHRVVRGFDVTGFVRNLDDGRVELVVEGESSEIDSVLKEIAGRMGQFIGKAMATSGAATGEFVRFDICH